VGDEEVYVLGGIDGAAFAEGVGGAGFVSVGAERVGGFDLDAEEAASVVEDEAVAFAVAPGFGDAESERAGFVEEGGFAALSASFRVGPVTTKADGQLEFQTFALHALGPLKIEKARLWPRLFVYLIVII
jgi:hypothetical protein